MTAEKIKAYQNVLKKYGYDLTEEQVNNFIALTRCMETVKDKPMLAVFSDGILTNSNIHDLANVILTAVFDDENPDMSNFLAQLIGTLSVNMMLQLDNPYEGVEALRKDIALALKVKEKRESKFEN